MNKPNKPNKPVKTTKPVKSNKPVKAIFNQKILGKCSTVDWFKSDNTRPKLVHMTFERTNEGYRMIRGAILKQTNQYTSDWIQADKRAMIKDIDARGIYAA